MAKYGYYEAKEKIESGQPYILRSAAAAWRNFAEALRDASAQLQGTSDTVTAQYGTPYQNFGDRAAPLASWMTSVSSNADAVASGLWNAWLIGSSAQITTYQEDASLKQTVDQLTGPAGVMSMGRAMVIDRQEAKAAAVLNAEIDKWTAAYEAFQPGTIAPAPTRTTSGRAGGRSDGTAGGSSTSSGGSGGQTGFLVGGAGGTGGEFPNSSVIGPEGGDFAGWVRDPRTGFLINPATGQEFDPVTGRWIDPVTGKPFGDVVQYATRLEGLGGVNQGPGLLASGPGGSPLLDGGGSGLAGLFGGVLPPSLAAGNPAANQLRQSAADSMAAKAYAAQQLALKEASQGGRPYLPPTQAGAVGSGGSRTGNRSRLVTEPETTWTSRPGRSARAGSGTAEEPLLATGRRGTSGRSGAAGLVEEPLLAGGTGTGAAGRAARRAGARGQGSGPATEPERAGPAVSRVRSAGGNRAYLPPMSGGRAGDQRDGSRKRPDWLVEDDVWSADQSAGPAVLGED